MFVNYKGTSLIQLFVLQTIISWKIFVWKRKGDTKSINFEALSSSRSHPGGKRTRIKTLEPRQGSPTSHGVWENPIDAFRSLENENLTSNPLGWTKDGYRVPSIIPDKRWKAGACSIEYARAANNVSVAPPPRVVASSGGVVEWRPPIDSKTSPTRARMSRHATTFVPRFPSLLTPFLFLFPHRRPVTQLRLLFEWTIKRPRGERLPFLRSFNFRSIDLEPSSPPTLFSPLPPLSLSLSNRARKERGKRVKGELWKNGKSGYCCHQPTKYSVCILTWCILTLSPCWWQGAHYAGKEANNNGRASRLSATCFDGEEDSGVSAAWNPAFFARAPGHASWNPVISSPREGWSPSLLLAHSISSSISRASRRRGVRSTRTTVGGKGVSCYFTRDVIQSVTTDSSPRGIRSVWRAREKERKEGRKKKAF